MTGTVHSADLRARDLFVTRWGVATIVGAVVVSACDALLLERSKGYFTGGFLSVDYLEGPVAVSMFLLTSLLIDAGWIGLITAVVAWCLGHTPLHARACMVAGFLTATGTLIAADVISYEILRYLGDAFDVALMFDLTGRSAAEVLAVASSHLIAPTLVVLGGVVAGGVVVALVQRRSSHLVEAAPGISVLTAPVVLGTIGCIVLALAATSSDVLENGLLRKPSGQAMAAVVNVLSDVDRDGYGIVGRSSDPDPFDAAVYPYAVDIPGNGVDEDGVGGDLPHAEAAPQELSISPDDWRRTPDVVLIVLESFRADVVGAQYSGKAITPVMDGIAARGVSIDAAFSHNGYTVQSRYHLLSGRVAKSGDGTSLIDDFRSNGYRVGYFSGQDESFGGATYDVGFSRAHVSYDARADLTRRYSTSATPGSLAVPMGVVQEHVAGFLQASGAGDQPLFLYINFHDTHFPYSHDDIETLISPTRLPRGRIAPSGRAALWATYVNTAANVDRAIGQVLDAIRGVRGRDPGVIITADHGESLFDEGFLGHGYGLNDAQTRIPLIVSNLPIELPEPFGQIDLRPAISAALSRPPEVSAKPVIRAAADPVFQYLGDISRPRQIAFLRSGGGRLIYDFRRHRVQLPDKGWVPPDEVPQTCRPEFLELVWQWERLNLASQRVGG